MGNAVAKTTEDNTPAITDAKVPKPEDNYPKFLSTTGDIIAVALLSGHVAHVLPDEPTPLHPRFHREAVRKGAMPEAVALSMKTNGVSVEEQSADGRREIVLRNISSMVDQADANPDLAGKFFTNDGHPDTNVLSERCGFQVKAKERDAMWEVYQGEIG